MNPDASEVIDLASSDAGAVTGITLVFLVSISTMTNFERLSDTYTTYFLSCTSRYVGDDVHPVLTAAEAVLNG